LKTDLNKQEPCPSEDEQLSFESYEDDDDEVKELLREIKKLYILSLGF
jgi:hypothetical protein